MMPGRKFSAGSGYRYGFNGKENDNEVKGEGNQQDYGMRIYDTRLGKFLSIDPLTRSYPNLSPYPFAMNRPIDGIDLDGKEWIHFNVKFTKKDGKLVVLGRTTVKDYRSLPENQLNSLHKTKSFYTEYSQGFGTKGQGVLFTYEEVDGNGKTIATSNKMEVVTSLTRHGFYAGQGCITKYGELITPGKYGNYDFGMKPIDMADAIWKEHDYFQNLPNHKGFLNEDYLNSDLIFLRKMVKFRDIYQVQKNYKDPFTGRAVSQEQKDFVDNAINLFKMFVASKVEILNQQLKKGELAQKEFDAKMSVYKRQELLDRLPLPNPNDNLNTKSK